MGSNRGDRDWGPWFADARVLRSAGDPESVNRAEEVEGEPQVDRVHAHAVGFDRHDQPTFKLGHRGPHRAPIGPAGDQVVEVPISPDLRGFVRLTTMLAVGSSALPVDIVELAPDAQEAIARAPVANAI